MSTQDKIEIAGKSVTGEGRPGPLSRRALIRGGAAAMPVILTLQSGAALARSSNLISASAPGTTDALGRTLCLDTNSVIPAGSVPGKYDLGEPPHAVVNIITERDYHTEANQGSDVIGEGSMCTIGGPNWWKPASGPWEQVNLPANGIIVSSGAVTSFAGVITDNLI